MREKVEREKRCMERRRNNKMENSVALFHDA